MPNRILRPGILRSARVNALSAEAEVFYRRLISIVDDYGRAEGDWRLLRTDCYPTRTDSISQANIEAWLAECCCVLDGEQEPLIRVYWVRRRRYIEVTNFGQQIRSASRFPAPPEQTILPNSRVNETQTVGVSSDSSAGQNVTPLTDIKCLQMISSRARTHTTTHTHSHVVLERGCGGKPEPEPTPSPPDPKPEFWPGFVFAMNKAQMIYSEGQVGALLQAFGALSLEDRQAAIGGIELRINSGEYADPAFVPAAQRYLRERRWTAPPRATPQPRRSLAEERRAEADRTFERLLNRDLENYAQRKIQSR